MDPLKILEEEHRIIEKNIAVLESISERILSGEEPPVEDLEKTIDFIKTFADKCHHGKEENKLFPKMESRGVPRFEGPIGVMLFEHEVGRRYVKSMVEALSSIKSGSKKGYLEFRSHALGYAQLLREHISKEDNILYPIARQVLKSRDFEELKEEFEKVEEELGLGVHEKYVKLVGELYEKYC